MKRKTPIWKDPIVEEVHKTRRKLFAACGNDLEQFCKSLRKRQKASERAGWKVVKRAPRRPVHS